ncbi:hypothetical protein BJY01DRAFT_207272 [Aspergillus pseudoustus]|uniref:Uncharacterized protein n=1 Tax=Aspergillus pseudoustus TaxID=1810923 RepID=A0ABR4KM09_9EURO
MSNGARRRNSTQQSRAKGSHSNKPPKGGKPPRHTNHIQHREPSEQPVPQEDPISTPNGAPDAQEYQPEDSGSNVNDHTSREVAVEIQSLSIEDTRTISPEPESEFESESETESQMNSQLVRRSGCPHQRKTTATIEHEPTDTGTGNQQVTRAVKDVSPTIGQTRELAQNLGEKTTGTLGSTASQAVKSPGKQKDEQLRLRLDMDLDIELKLKAKICGDLTLQLSK